MPSAALVAATRFGFAARGDDLALIGRDPRGWALGQLDQAPAPLAADLQGAAHMVTRMLEVRRDKDPGSRQEFQQEVRAGYLAGVAARLAAAAEADAPLRERLVHFWGNHFTVSGLRPAVRGLAAAFEREAVRPHVLGRFADLLLAAEQHPAMLFYLDNVGSIGPDSPVGRQRGRGLNENLGREILELHTLGVDGGYGQADVEALARILTGWSVARPDEPEAGAFRFRPAVHQPGPKVLLGQTYAEAGHDEGVAALRDLARHPATARHVAMKLARHFIADAPPEDAVARIARRFEETDGDLRAVTAAVVAEEAAWQAPFAKLRTPWELAVAACRVTGFAPPAEMLAGGLRRLDQPCFFAPSPAGWPDAAAAWLSPEAVLRRAQWCERFAHLLPEPPDPAALAEAGFGDALSGESAAAVGRAPSRRLAVALLLAAPEFQRR